MAEVVAQSDYQIVIDGTVYSMTQIPDGTSPLVQSEQGRVLRNLKLDKLISNLMRAGELLFCAYNGVAGFGELRAAVTKISDQLAVLTGDCEAAMQGFQRSASSILGNLRDCFKFLLSGKEDWAVKWLAKAGAAAKDMANRADGLASRFDALGNDAIEILGKTQVAQGQAEAGRDRLQRDMADLQAKTVAAKTLTEELIKQKEKLQNLYNEAKEKAESAENRAFALAIVNSVMKPLGDGLGAFAGVMARTSSPLGMMPPAVPVPASQPSSGLDRAPGSGLNPPQNVGSDRAANTGLDRPPASDPDRSPETGLDRPPGTPPYRASDSDLDRPPGSEPDRPPATGPDRPPSAGNDQAPGTSASSTQQAATAAMAGAGAAMSSAGDSAGQMGGDYYSVAEAYRKEKLKYLENLLDLQKQERETAAKIAEYAERLKSAGQAKEISEATINSLFQAIGALKQIAVVLRVTAMFWRQMADHCEELAKPDLIEKIQLFKELPADERRTFYVEEDFKLAVVTHLAGWKAIEVVAIDYGRVCGEVRAQIQDDFVKNPSTEQSRALAPVLGAKLLADAQADLGKSDAQATALLNEIAATQQAA
jgi:hypothetical protein